MIEYNTGICNSANSEAKIFGLQQSLFFLLIGAIVLGFLGYVIMGYLKLKVLRIAFLIIITKGVLVLFFYLKNKGDNFIFSDFQKSFSYAGKLKWIKATVKKII